MTPPRKDQAPAEPEPEVPEAPAPPEEAAPAAEYAHPTNVIQAISAVMRDLPGIGRNNRSEQGYNYRGIEAVTAEVQPLLGKYGLVFVPRVVARFTKDFTINSKPWTEEQLTVIYRVYGPAGAEDFIEVGPVVGLGRDNSDKGANKAMTQAFKYALLQTFCVADAKDDGDKDPKHEADAKRAPAPRPTPLQRDQQALRDRIDGLSTAAKAALGEWCDKAEVPRKTSDMTDVQVKATGQYLDGLANTAAQTPQEAPAASDGADTAAESPEQPETGQSGEPDATPEAYDATQDGEYVAVVTAWADALSLSEVNTQLAERGLEASPPNPKNMRATLAADVIGKGELPEGVNL